MHSSLPVTTDSASDRKQHFVPMNAVMQGSLHNMKRKQKHLFLRDFSSNTAAISSNAVKESHPTVSNQVTPKRNLTSVKSMALQAGGGAGSSTATTNRVVGGDGINVYLKKSRDLLMAAPAFTSKHDKKIVANGP